jgi:GT2 family glycosyltransferase
MSALSRPILSFVIPTHNRPDVLRETLSAIDALDFDEHQAEVVVVDNASDVQVNAESSLPTTVLRLRSNMGAAGRNVGAEWARGEWVVMLDDDSAPVDGDGLLAALWSAPDDAAAVMADIHLSGDRGRERGGLPEVFVGCGVAIRREIFLRLDGYDPSFEYYAEEYDLAARMIGAGYKIVFDPRFTVEHRKVESGRDFGRIVRRLVRNNGLVMQRYAPQSVRRAMLRLDRRRYRQIAEKERATIGYTEGVLELRQVIREQRRTPLTQDHFDRFTGLAHARSAFKHAHSLLRFTTAALVEPGKTAGVLSRHWAS